MRKAFLRTDEELEQSHKEKRMVRVVLKEAIHAIEYLQGRVKALEGGERAQPRANPMFGENGSDLL